MANQKACEHISQKVKDAFEKMDQDGSGVVSFGEFKEFCKSVPGMEGMAEAFCVVDTSDDSKISLEELNDLCTNKIPPHKIEEEHVKDLFHKLDTDNSGALDREEFEALLLDCGYSGDTIKNTISHVAGADGKVTLQEFLQNWLQDA